MNHGDAIFCKSDLMVIWVQLLVDPSQLIVQYRLTKSVFINCVFHPEMNFGSKNNATIKTGQDILKGVCYYDGHLTFAITSASRQPKNTKKHT